MIAGSVPKTLIDAVARCGLAGALIGRSDVARLTVASGAYLLVLGLRRPIAIQLRRRTAQTLPAGWYLYAGSACGPGGLKARIGRHFRRGKARHWHIDALTDEAVLYAITYPGGDECDLVAALNDHPHVSAPVPGFGSSDCRTCASHLLAWSPVRYQPGSMP
jgi:Uri superfamily endonuclease